MKAYVLAERGLACRPPLADPVRDLSHLSARAEVHPRRHSQEARRLCLLRTRGLDSDRACAPSDIRVALLLAQGKRRPRRSRRTRRHGLPPRGALPSPELRCQQERERRSSPDAFGQGNDGGEAGAEGKGCAATGNEGPAVHLWAAVLGGAHRPAPAAPVDAATWADSPRSEVKSAIKRAGGSRSDWFCSAAAPGGPGASPRAGRAVPAPRRERRRPPRARPG